METTIIADRSGDLRLTAAEKEERIVALLREKEALPVVGNIEC